jgi:hypothetical protein
VENPQADNKAAQNAAQHGPRTEHAPKRQHSADLVKVIDAWSSLSDDAKEAILQIVFRCRGNQERLLSLCVIPAGTLNNQRID